MNKIMKAAFLLYPVSECDKALHNWFLVSCCHPHPKLKIPKYLIIWFLFGIFSGKWIFYYIHLLLSDLNYLNYDDEQAKNITALSNV